MEAASKLGIWSRSSFRPPWVLVAKWLVPKCRCCIMSINDRIVMTFLRRYGGQVGAVSILLIFEQVSKWYNLIIFTASVQEYADPVIDWLEVERKYFVGRYYRQHCTFRNGAYIKDLAQVEPDLSKVMILDNSPLSYVFHPGEICRCGCIEG